MIGEKMLYYVKKAGHITIALALLLLLLSSCSIAGQPNEEQDIGMQTENQEESTTTDKPTPITQDNPPKPTECDDDNPLMQVPDETEKAAIIEKYGLSEEEYNNYLDSWQRPDGGQEAGMTLDYYIGMMEEQKAAHETM